MPITGDVAGAFIREVTGVAKEAGKRVAVQANKNAGEVGIFDKAFKWLEKHESTKFLAPGDEVSKKVFQKTDHLTKETIPGVVNSYGAQYQDIKKAVDSGLDNVNINIPGGGTMNINKEQAKKVLEQYEKTAPHQSEIFKEISEKGGYTRSQTLGEKTKSYFSHEDYGTKRKIAAGVGIGGVALGGFALTRDEDSSGAMGAVLGGTGAAGAMGYAISKM